MGTVFRIDGVECVGSNQSKVRLSLSSTTNEENVHQTLLYSSMESAITTEPTILHRLAKMLFMMGQYSKAKQMYATLIETTHPDDRLEIAYLNFKLGRVHDEEGLPEQAYRHFYQALEHLPLDTKGTSSFLFGEKSKSLYISDGKQRIPFIHLQLSHTLQQMDRLKEARDNIDEGFASAKKVADSNDYWIRALTRK
jgi:tetratricopeptide (TPR) repeat protein